MQAKLLIVTTVPLMLRGFLLPFAYHFKSLGWQVDAMVKADDSQIYKDCEAAFDTIHDIPWSRSPIDPKNFMQAPKRVKDVLEQEHYDIVHVHSPIASFVTRYALRNMRNETGPKVIYTTHGFHFHRDGNVLKNAVFERLERTAGPWTDQLVVINREDEAAARRLKLVPEDKLMYMPGIGVDTKKYNAKDVRSEQIATLQTELNVKEDDKLILMIAEFNPGKRHSDALKALEQLKDKSIILLLAGVGPLEDGVKTQAEALGVADQIRMLGYRKDIPVLLKASDALLLPSEREGLPRSILEAMCAGTPVIGTSIRGVEDLLADGCGIMTAVGDLSAMAKAMHQMTDNKEEASQMATRASEKMKDFSLDNIIRLHEELYAKILGTELRNQTVGAKAKELSSAGN